MSFYSKPIQVILVASALLSLLVMLGLLAFNLLSDIEVSNWFYIIFPLLVGLSSFLIFSFFIERFINKKIKVIYKTISQKKSVEKKEAKLNDDVLEVLTKDTEVWADQQLRQIEGLEKQAAFRREFLGNLAHELKTPVFSIQGYILTLLEGGLEDKSVNRLFLNKALKGVERITSVLDDLDDINRFEFDRFNLKIVRFDIVQLLIEIYDTVDSKARRKTISLKFDRNYDPVFVNADKGKIAQVLINLISNSIAYGNDNGATSIKLTKVDKRIVLIEVVDDGIGIDGIHFSRLFERFYRVEKSRARNIAGSGLGLSIVKHIIEAHKQTINVQSTVGEGSVFSFTLNLA